MRAPALGCQLCATVRTLLGAVAEAGALRSRVVRSFATQDLLATAQPAAALLLAAALLAAVGAAWVVRTVSPLGASVASAAVRELLVVGGPLACALLVVAVVSQRRVSALWSTLRRGEVAAIEALGLSPARVLDVPWLAGHAAAGAVGASLWLFTGIVVVPLVAMFFDAGVGADTLAFLLSSIRPLDPWLAALHGGWLSAAASAGALVAARDPGRPATQDEGEAQAAVMSRALLLAAAAAVLAEAAWWATAWLAAPWG